MRVELGDWETMQRWAAPLRFAVFVKEQSVPEQLEIDDWDVRCVHAVAFDGGGAAVGTGRLLPDGHIGRMAVARSHRGCGVGSRVLMALQDEARRRGDCEVVLSAQTHAVAFYEKHGYRTEGKIYLDAGIEHVDMRLRLQPA